VKLFIILASLLTALVYGQLVFPTGYAISSGATASTNNPVSGSAAWYKADVGVTCTSGCSNGNTVTSWADQSGNANTLTCTGGTTYVTSAINGLAAVAFNGTSGVCTFGTAINLCAGESIYTELKATNATVNSEIVGGASATFGYILNGTLSLEQSIERDNVQALGAGNTAADTNFHQINQTWAGASSGAITFRLGRATDGTPASANTCTGNSANIGENVAATLFANMQLAEIIIYTSALTTGNTTTNETYLNGRYAN